MYAPCNSVDYLVRFRTGIDLGTQRLRSQNAGSAGSGAWGAAREHLEDRTDLVLSKSVQAGVLRVLHITAQSRSQTVAWHN